MTSRRLPAAPVIPGARRGPVAPARRRSALAVAGCAILLLSSCAAESATAPSGAVEDFSGCVLASDGGFRDRSFNQDIYESTVVLRESLGIEVRTQEPTTPREAVQMLEQMASPDSGCDLVVAMGTPMVEHLEAAAQRHPEQRFAIVDDTTIDLPNVRTISFDASQPGFLAGYVSASATETGAVAAYGGKDIPEVRDFLDGYAAGIQHWNEVHDEDVELLGWDPASGAWDFLGDFDDVDEAAELTRERLADGADVILPVAGRAGLGTAEVVAEDDDALFVWIDIDGWDVLPDDQRTRQLTSVRKDVGPAVADVMTQSATSGFDPEPYLGTLANGGVALAEYHAQEQRVGEQTAVEVWQLRQEIIEGSQPTRPVSAP